MRVRVILAAVAIGSMSVAGPVQAQVGEVAVPQPEAEPEVAEQQPESSRVEALADRVEELEMELLQLSAYASVDTDEEELKLISYQSAGRSLQALNPELSVEADVLGSGVYSDGHWYSGDSRSGVTLRELAFNLHSTLDPFSFVRVAAAIAEDGAELEEAYITYTSILPRLSLTVGRFRQQLGVVNRWHEHGLDQSHYPLMLTAPLGNHGLAQSGISLEWLAPSLWADALEVTLQVTNGENPEVFSGELFSFPTTLLKVKNYWDLSSNTYFELGASGALGFNHQRGEDGSGAVLAESARTTALAGFDMTLSWEPRQRAKYEGVIWRSEALYVRKELPGGSLDEFWGAYSYVEAKAGINLYAGLRGDIVYMPRDPLLTGRYAVAAVPYLTWWQSEFVRVRLEYNAAKHRDAAYEHRGLLQLSFAAGPHKHERY